MLQPVLEDHPWRVVIGSVFQENHHRLEQMQTRLLTSYGGNISLVTYFETDVHQNHLIVYVRYDNTTANMVLEDMRNRDFDKADKFFITQRMYFYLIFSFYFKKF